MRAAGDEPGGQAACIVAENAAATGDLTGAVTAINAQFEIILSALPGIARKAAIVAERRPR